MTTQLSTGSLEINSFNDLLSFAERISKSTMIPKDYINRPDNILVAVMMGKELNLKPLQALQSIATINGRPSIYGDAALALAMSSANFEGIEEDDFESIKTNKKATCVVKRKGMPPIIRTFSYDDAKRAGLIGKSGPWTQYEPRMYQMRARAFALRDAFPDILKGIHIAEEAQDIPAEKDVTPAQDKINVLIKQKNDLIQTDTKNNSLEHKEEDSDLVIPMTMIEHSKTIEDLKLSRKYITMLTELEEKNTATRAYNIKLKELKEKELESKPDHTENKADSIEAWVADFDNAK